MSDQRSTDSVNWSQEPNSEARIKVLKWHKGCELAMQIHRLTSGCPSEEGFDIVNGMEEVAILTYMTQCKRLSGQIPKGLLEFL